MFDSRQITFFGAQLLGIDAMVIPIKLLAQIPDPPDELAMPGRAFHRSLCSSKNQLCETSRLCKLDVLECLSNARALYSARQAHFDEALVHLGFVLHERNLQFVLAQVGSQSFQSRGGLLIGGVG